MKRRRAIAVDKLVEFNSSPGRALIVGGPSRTWRSDYPIIIEALCLLEAVCSDICVAHRPPFSTVVKRLGAQCPDLGIYDHKPGASFVVAFPARDTKDPLADPLVAEAMLDGLPVLAYYPGGDLEWITMETYLYAGR